MTTITGLNKLHPISHASLFLDLCERNAKSQVAEDRKLYEYYLNSLSDRKDAISNVIPSVVELINRHREESEKMHKEESKQRAEQNRHTKVNGRSFDGLRTSMGTAWNIKKKRVSNRYIQEQREKYSDIIDKDVK